MRVALDGMKPLERGKLFSSIDRTECCKVVVVMKERNQDLCYAPMSCDGTESRSVQCP